MQLRLVLALRLFLLRRAKTTWLENICLDQSSWPIFWQNKTRSGKSTYSWSIVHLYTAVWGSAGSRIYFPPWPTWEQNSGSPWPTEAWHCSPFWPLPTFIFHWAASRQFTKKLFWSDPFPSLQEIYMLYHTCSITSCSQEQSTQGKSALHIPFSPFTAAASEMRYLRELDWVGLEGDM